MGVGAGIIRISGGNLPAGIALMPDSSNEYIYTASGVQFDAGQTLGVTTSGGAVPAFAASVVAPGVTSLYAPATNGTTYTIPTTTDLTVAWIPADTPVGVQMVFGGEANTANGPYFVCGWDASLGKALVPQAILAGLAGQMNGILYYGLTTTTNVNPGGYAVAVSAIQYGAATASFP
jgi:hypothetical protein